MNQNNSDATTFRVTVSRLFVSVPLPKQDLRVTVCVSDLSKITCMGSLSEDCLTVTWDHPFLFTTTSLSTPVEFAICTLPEQLSPQWDKEFLGNQMVSNVAALLESRNEWQCNVSGLPAGSATLFIMCSACDVLNVLDGHNCVAALMEYEIKLSKFGNKFKNIACVSTEIEMNLASLDLCPIGHPNHTNILNNLASSLSLHYDQEGRILDLVKAIEVFQIRLDLCPLGHPEHAKALAELAIDLHKYYTIQQNKEDLNRLIEIQKEWLDLCPSGHPDHPRALGELAVSLWEYYNARGSITDLNKAIEMEEEQLDLCPEGHSLHGLALHNLALFMATRYHVLGNLADLDRAITLQEECLKLYSPGHLGYGHVLMNLATSIWDHYHRVKDYADLTKAVKLFKEALKVFPVEHPYFAFCAAQLAETILLSFTSSQTHPPPYQPSPSLDEAFQTYRLLKNCGPAVTLKMWYATQAWVKDAEEHNHPSVLEAYQTSLNTLDQFTSFNSSLDSRHEVMQSLPLIVADLANNAFSCALRYGDFQLAVELLEQGRGILWNQLARFDDSLAALEAQGDEGRELGRTFARLSADLKEHAEGGKGSRPYWQVHEEWQSVVTKIRDLERFSRFLLPPCFDDLRKTAEYGPVVIVNASKYACDALIVLHARLPVHVPLPCSLADLDQLCSQLLELTQDVHAYGTNRESWVKEMLRDLWSSVVEPIVDVLQDDVQLPSGSRIWWCPTSKFTTLPLHAAGPHRKTAKNLMDIYVPSYAPSLSALVRARARIRSQRAGRGTSRVPNAISFAAVNQARPSADTKLGQLPQVKHEIQRIRDDTGMRPNVTFESVSGSAATIEGAVQAFRNHHWVHVACHGAQHAAKPFASWFAMGDGKLTLMRVIQERYTQSEFAFLSACHTAVGDSSTPDEVLHLAAGMQFAGFNGVIGTLWKVDDAVAHQVVTQFYKEMFQRPVVDFEHAAGALNAAVLKTADQVSLEKRIVFVHIGV